MPYRFFFLESSKLDLDELNNFLKNHHILSEDWDTCMQGGVHYQVLRVKYEDFPKDSGSSNRSSYNSSDAYKTSKHWDKDKEEDKDKKDENGHYEVKYPDNITEDQKKLFDVLRQERREFARELNFSAPFMLFDNNQLGELIAKNISTVAEAREIAGIGEARIRYVPRMLVALLKARGQEIPQELLEQAAKAAAELKTEQASKEGLEKGGKKSSGKSEKSKKAEKKASDESKSSEEGKPSEEEKTEESPVVQGELFSESEKK
jgi:hypothetical protein